MSYDKNNLFPEPLPPKINPCPVCGKPSARVKFYPGQMKRRYSVYCRHCKTRLTHRFLTEAEAINAWNKARRSKP